MKKNRMRLLCLMLAALLPGTAAAAETDPAEPTAIPVFVEVCQMDTLPGSWSPLTPQTPEKELIRALTSAKLYRLSQDGSQILPEMAGALPEDVTGEYAGMEPYGVPARAQRGYAYRIDLNPDVCWEDGTPITAEDYLFSFEKLVGSEVSEGAYNFLANAEHYLSGTLPQPVAFTSLEEAGFASVDEAREAGYTDFYVDVSHFWGLDAGWCPITDGTRLRDYAMPAGLKEMFVSPAYLYRNYLADGMVNGQFQAEFVGIPGAQEIPLTFADVGILQTGENQLTLVLEQPLTAAHLAMLLEPVFLFRQDKWSGSYGTGPQDYCAYGPYRVASASPEQIVLEKNPNWWGEETGHEDTILFRP